MIVDGSIWIYSDVKIYEPNEFLCCNEEKEKLMDEYNNLRSRPLNEINPWVNRLIKEKWWQHHLKEKECLSMQSNSYED